MQFRIALIVALTAALPALAILVDSPHRARYEQAPADDPGFENVGYRAGTSAIYLGDGWVLTARHSGFGPVEFDSKPYEAVPSSLVGLHAPNDAKRKADLIVFRLDPEPELPSLELTDTSPAAGEDAILVGFGSGRAAPVERKDMRGFRIDGQRSRRWGTNRLDPGRVELPGPNQVTTQCFEMFFDPEISSHEAQATVGDSGGAVFIKEDGGWRLAGLILSVYRFSDQDPEEVLFGNATLAADLSLYKPQIDDAIGRD